MKKVMKCVESRIVKNLSRKISKLSSVSLFLLVLSFYTVCVSDAPIYVTHTVYTRFPVDDLAAILLIFWSSARNMRQFI